MNEDIKASDAESSSQLLYIKKTQQTIMAATVSLLLSRSIHILILVQRARNKYVRE